jgi:hypothetical protein
VLPDGVLLACVAMEKELSGTTDRDR